VRLFSFGRNQTAYGDLYLTPESARACLDFENQLGRDLCWDFNHHSEPSGPRPMKAEDAGAIAWFSLSIGPDGLYASAPRRLSTMPAAELKELAAQTGLELPIDGIAWLRTGRAAVESLTFRYFSPGVQLARDPQTQQRLIVGVTSCALTNSPATHQQEPLLCSTTGQKKMTWEQLLAQLTARGASQAEIDQAKADFDAAQTQAAPAAQPSAAANLTAPAAQPDATERRRLILLAYSNRFEAAERPALERIEPETLEALLSSRAVSALRQAPATPAAPANTARITGGNNPLTIQGRRWEDLNYRNRHALFLSDRDLYDKMIAQCNEQKRRVCLLSSPELENQPLLLATGTTGTTHVSTLIPQVLNQAIEAGIPGLRAFIGSDVVMYDGSMPEFDQGGKKIKGGSVVTIPTFSAIGAFVDASAEINPATNTQRLDSSSVTATVVHGLCGVEMTYSAQAFAGALQDPYVEASRQLFEQGRNYMEDKLIAEARTTDLALDITAIGDGLLSYDAIVDALALWGDEEFENQRASMAMAFWHSGALKQLRKIKDSQGRPIFYEPNDGNPPSVLGKPSRISDRLTVNGGSNHESLLARPRSLALWVNEGHFRLQEYQDVQKDTKIAYVHLYCAPKLWPTVPGKSKKGMIKITHKP
jgi:hypothetical protein